MRPLRFAQLPLLAALCLVSSLVQAAPDEQASVSYRVVLESQQTETRALDEEGTAALGYPWAFAGQVNCSPSFPCAPDTRSLSWSGQALAELPAGAEGSPVVRVQVTLTEHTSAGNRVKNVSWQGPVTEVYPDKDVGKWFRLRSASRLNP